MDKDKEIDQLRSELAISKKTIKSLADKLKRSQIKVSKQKANLKKKEIKTIELTSEQLQSLSNQFPDINIRSLLFD